VGAKDVGGGGSGCLEASSAVGGWAVGNTPLTRGAGQAPASQPPCWHLLLVSAAGICRVKALGQCDEVHEAAQGTGYRGVGR